MVSGYLDWFDDPAGYTAVRNDSTADSWESFLRQNSAGNLKCGQKPAVALNESRLNLQQRM